MRKLVHTMLKYDKETSFSQQANLMQNTTYEPEKDFVAVSTGGGLQSSRTLALASSTRPKRKRNTSHVAQSEYVPEATGTFGVAYGDDDEAGSPGGRGGYAA